MSLRLGLLAELRSATTPRTAIGCNMQDAEFRWEETAGRHNGYRDKRSERHSRIGFLRSSLMPGKFAEKKLRISHFSLARWVNSTSIQADLWDWRPLAGKRLITFRLLTPP